MDENNKRAQSRKRYEDKRIFKKVSFNTETDAELLEVVKNLDFSQWVKDKLRELLKK